MTQTQKKPGGDPQTHRTIDRVTQILEEVVYHPGMSFAELVRALGAALQPFQQRATRAKKYGEFRRATQRHAQHADQRCEAALPGAPGASHNWPADRTPAQCGGTPAGAERVEP